MSKQPIIQVHSCRACKYCKSKTSNKSATARKTYYECDKTKTMITESVYQTNDCLTFISRK